MKDFQLTFHSASDQRGLDHKTTTRVRKFYVFLMTRAASLASCSNSGGFSRTFRNFLDRPSLYGYFVYDRTTIFLSYLFDFAFHFSLFTALFVVSTCETKIEKKNIAMKLKMLKAIFLFNHLLISVCEYVQRYTHSAFFFIL